MKLGFVKRTDDKSNENHKIVGVHQVDTDSFAMQLNLNLRNCWAVVEDVVGTVINAPEANGEYVFLREVSAQNYRLFKRQEAADEEEEEYESEEED